MTSNCRLVVCEVLEDETGAMQRVGACGSDGRAEYRGGSELLDGDRTNQPGPDQAKTMIHDLITFTHQE